MHLLSGRKLELGEQLVEWRRLSFKADSIMEKMLSLITVVGGGKEIRRLHKEYRKTMYELWEFEKTMVEEDFNWDYPDGPRIR